MVPSFGPLDLMEKGAKYPTMKGVVGKKQSSGYLMLE
jgi:hypothetical protein